MGVIGAGAAFGVHSLVRGDQSGSPGLEVAELRETVGPIAMPTPISLAATRPDRICSHRGRVAATFYITPASSTVPPSAGGLPQTTKPAYEPMKGPQFV
jgi:hypothetical protein